MDIRTCLGPCDARASSCKNELVNGFQAPHKDILLLGNHVLGKDLHTIFIFELANETGVPAVCIRNNSSGPEVGDIPKFAGNA